MSVLDITIAGAGIGGLAVAAALARNGHRVRVAERVPAITEVGAGIQISPNGRAVLLALGLGEAFDAISLPADAVELVEVEYEVYYRDHHPFYSPGRLPDHAAVVA